MTVFILAIYLLALSNASTAQTSPGTLETYSTIHSIGFEWPITGDSNHNSSSLVQYRVNGNSTWRDAQPLFRVDFETYDMLAGSILFLNPDTEYEVQLTLADSDGVVGGNPLVRTELIRTQKIPIFPTAGNTYHVIPGTSGGDGSVGNPFQGMAEAQAAAQAGDIFLLHAGDYGINGQINFTQGGSVDNHIVWRAAGDGAVIFNQIRIEADYIWLHELNFIYNELNGQYGLRTSPPAPKGIVLTYNHFENCHYCIFLNDGGENWYITDNTIVGNNDINAGSDFSGEGIELQHTSGHTVAYNKISDVADGISYPHHNVDIFGNEIFNTTDDGIEGDYGHANIRIWGNRISNTYNNGISFQPMDGAPWYVLYNQVAAPGEDALKLRSRTDRVLLAHNTLVAWNGPVSSGSELLRNFKSNNNLWISIEDRYVWENGVDGSNNWKTDLDYDGFDWGNYPYAFKWGDNVRLTDINEFYKLTGHEQHAVQIDHNTCFSMFNIPSPPPVPVAFQHLTLDPNCPAVDAGLALANINDHHAINAPDLGAHEIGQAPPHYGPRSQLSDLIFADGFEQ
ncbi:MAG: right-handed parallel beta-helix repeat-containing protein [Marinicella sp.]